MNLDIVIPALNEEKTIRPLLSELLQRGVKVWVVDDGSSDQTGAIAEQEGARVIRHPSPRGYDAALSSGINAAFGSGAGAVVTCDADGQHKVEDVFRVAEPVRQARAEISCGVRDVYNRPIERLISHLSFPILNTRDPFCGMKCYSKTVYLDCGPFPQDLNTGLLPLVWAKKREYRVAFFPIRAEKRADKPRLGNQIRATYLLSRAFSKTLFELYRI
jgi:glycosyltransferase involved in cell wall biosynthesis